MNHETLSLKNIYRLIRVRDYPVPSDGVLAPSRTKGLTLLSFWKQILLERWLQTRHGRIIWRTEGSINRYHSELCNRKKLFPFYADYAGEILEGLTDEEVFHQAELFAHFLRERKYRRPIFLQKAAAYFAALREEDRRSAANNLLGPVREAERSAEVPPAFWDGWMLTMLTLYALSDGLISVSSFPEGSLALFPERLYQTCYLQLQTPVRILTDQSSELWQFRLAPESFFGREQELFDLEEAALTGKKMLICGLGGMGKTELLRQFLSRMLQRKAFQRIATVQYNGDLTRSFAKSFLRLNGASPEECFNESLYLLSEQEGTLLLLDHLTRPDDPALAALEKVPCTVLVTARFTSLPGFEAFPLSAPDQQAATLIFRSYYRLPLGREDYAAMDRFMAQDLLHHPLTITMLAKASRANAWSIGELANRIESGYSDIHFQEDSREIYLSQILQHLYQSAGMSPEKQRLLRLIALLPYGGYTPEELVDISDLRDTDQMKDCLEWLGNRGWLDYSGESNREICAMHPLISECVRARLPLEEEFPRFWERARQTLAYDIRSLPEEDANSEKIRLAESLLHAVSLLSRPVSRNLVEICLQACLWLDEDPGAAQQLQKIISALEGENRDLLLRMDERFMSYGASSGPEMRRRMEEELSHPILSPVEHSHYVCACIYVMVYDFNFSRALSLIEEEKRKDLTPYEREKLLAGEYNCRANAHSYAQAYEISLQGKALAEQLEAGRKKKPMTLLWAEYQAANHIQAMRWDKLDEVQQEISSLRASTPESLTQKVQAEANCANLMEKQGRLQDAIGIWMDLQDQFSRYLEKGASLYVQACCQLGLLQAKAGNWEDASRHYAEGIQLCRTYEKNAPLLHVLLNNDAALLLDMNQPEKAFPLLQEAITLATPLGGIPLAEPQKNLARCLTMMGETEEANKLFAQVYSVFEENYGPSHPKTLEVQKQLRLLSSSD